MVSIEPLMNPVNLFFSLILTFSPIIILFLPYLFTRRKEENLVAVIFNRAYIGFIVFFLAYFIFPSILNSFVPNPTQYLDQEYYPVSGTGRWGGEYSTTWDSAASPVAATLPGMPMLIRFLFQHFVRQPCCNFREFPDQHHNNEHEHPIRHRAFENLGERRLLIVNRALYRIDQ